jgi:hypothetical protein
VGGVQIIHQEGPDVKMRKVIWTVRHTCIGAAALSFHGNPDLYRGGGTYLLDHGVPYDDLELGSGPDGRVRIVERNSWYELGNRRRTKRVKWLSTITAPPDFQWVSDEPFGKQRGIDQVKSHCSRTTDGSGYPLYLNVLKCTLFSYKFR